MKLHGYMRLTADYIATCDAKHGFKIPRCATKLESCDNRSKKAYIGRYWVVNDLMADLVADRFAVTKNQVLD